MNYVCLQATAALRPRSKAVACILNAVGEDVENLSWKYCIERESNTTRQVHRIDIGITSIFPSLDSNSTSTIVVSVRMIVMGRDGVLSADILYIICVSNNEL